MFAFLPGFFTGLSLIIAIGAQNAFVIRQGLTKRYVFTVVAICTIIDAALIALGIGGLGAAISGLPWLLEIIRWFGVAYLTWFGIKSVISATKTQTLDPTGVESKSATKVITTVLAMSLLNPHVYLDTVIFVGGVGNAFGESRWFLPMARCWRAWFGSPESAMAPRPRLGLCLDQFSGRSWMESSPPSCSHWPSPWRPSSSKD